MLEFGKNLDYYDKFWEKILDFFFGGFFIWIINILCFVLILLFLVAIEWIVFYISGIAIMEFSRYHIYYIPLLLIWFINNGLAYLSYHYSRKYLGIGIIIISTLPLTFFMLSVLFYWIIS